MMNAHERRAAVEHLWVEIVKALRLVQIVEWLEQQIERSPRLHRWLS